MAMEPPFSKHDDWGWLKPGCYLPHKRKEPDWTKLLKSKPPQTARATTAMPGSRAARRPNSVPGSRAGRRPVRPAQTARPSSSSSVRSKKIHGGRSVQDRIEGSFIKRYIPPAQRCSDVLKSTDIINPMRLARRERGEKGPPKGVPKLLSSPCKWPDTLPDPTLSRKMQIADGHGVLLKGGKRTYYDYFENLKAKEPIFGVFYASRDSDFCLHPLG